MITFSMDESGYTGYDLLHKEQKFQGASSILINHDDASRLIKEYFPKLQADELKYSSLKRRDSTASHYLNCKSISYLITHV